MQDTQNLSPSLEHKVLNHSHSLQLHAVLLTAILFIFAALGIRQKAGFGSKIDQRAININKGYWEFKS